MASYNLIEKAFSLKKTAPFGMLDLEILLAIGERVSVLAFNKGDKIFQMGQEDNRLYILVEGSVEVRGAQGVIMATLKPHEVFGDESLLNGLPKHYEAVAREQCVLLTMTRSTLFTVISESPSVAIALLQEYAATTAFRPRRT